MSEPAPPANNENAFENLAVEGESGLARNMAAPAAAPPPPAPAPAPAPAAPAAPATPAAVAPSPTRNTTDGYDTDSEAQSEGYQAGLNANEDRSASPVAAVPEKKPLSDKAKDLQARRKVVLTDMQGEYKRTFGDNPKAPKAKAYHAAGLLTIREKEGEEAYRRKLQEYISQNERHYTMKAQGKKPTKTAVKLSNSAVPLNSSAASSKSMSNEQMVRSMTELGFNAKKIIDKMISATKVLAQRMQTARPHKTRSNKGKTHKRRTPNAAV